MSRNWRWDWKLPWDGDRIGKGQIWSSEVSISFGRRRTRTDKTIQLEERQHFWHKAEVLRWSGIRKIRVEEDFATWVTIIGEPLNQSSQLGWRFCAVEVKFRLTILIKPWTSFFYSVSGNENSSFQSRCEVHPINRWKQLCCLVVSCSV